LVISSRYHGGIVSELSGVRSIIIGHHDKLYREKNYINYYGINKAELWKKYNEDINEKVDKDISFGVIDLVRREFEVL